MIKTLRFTLLAALMLICGKMSAQEVTLDFSSNGWNLPAESTKQKATYTNGGYTITLETNSGGYQYLKTKSCLVLGTTGATLTLPAFNFPVSKIEIITDYKTSDELTQNFFVGNVPVSTETKGNAVGSSNKYEIDENYQVAGTALTLKVLNAKYSSIKKIYIYKVADTSKKSPALQFSEKTVNYVIGDEFKAPTFTKQTTAKVTFKSDNEDVATVDANGNISVTGKAAGTANITATAAADGEYKAGSATCTINVTEPAKNIATFKKATTIESGKKYIFVAQRDNNTYYGKYIDKITSDNLGVMNTESVSGNVDELKVDTANAYTIEATEKGYTIKDCKGRYLSLDGESSRFTVDTYHKYSFTIEPQTDGTFKISMNGKFVVMGYVKRYPYTFGAVESMQDVSVMPMLYVLNDSSTGISNITAGKKATSNAIYNLAGQRVDKNYKGIVIVNGKKKIQK